MVLYRLGGRDAGSMSDNVAGYNRDDDADGSAAVRVHGHIVWSTLALRGLMGCPVHSLHIIVGRVWPWSYRSLFFRHLAQPNKNKKPRRRRRFYKNQLSLWLVGSAAGRNIGSKEQLLIGLK